MYRITYQVNIDWVGPGTGPMSGNTGAAIGQAPRGGAQTLAFFNSAPGQNYNGTFDATAITTLLAAMSSDLSTQMNVAATTARVAAFSTGGG